MDQKKRKTESERKKKTLFKYKNSGLQVKKYQPSHIVLARIQAKRSVV